MTLNIEGFMLNPFALIALTIVFGGYFGKLNLGGLKLGSSGSLFVGLGFGYLVYRLLVMPYAAASEVTDVVSTVLAQGLVPKSLFTFSLIGFIAPVGLLASSDIVDVIRKYGVKFVLLGIMITLSGALASIAFIGWCESPQNIGVIGTYVGALTSSPGLAASLEIAASKGTGGEALIGLGYAVGYIPGVLLVVVGMRLVPKWVGIDLEKERLQLLDSRKIEVCGMGVQNELPAETHFNIPLFMKICGAGILIGQVKFYFGSYLGWIGLGSTGGVLLASLLMGHFLTDRKIPLNMSKNTLSAIRDLSLNMFLAIVGLTYGYTTVTSIAQDGRVLLAAAVISGSAAMVTGIVVGRLIMKMNWIVLSGAICGGMTSTPGLAAAIETCEADEVAASYGATYPVALISMILFTTIMTYIA